MTAPPDAVKVYKPNTEIGTWTRRDRLTKDSCGSRKKQ
jgi:hypothetical protein